MIQTHKSILRGSVLAFVVFAFPGSVLAQTSWIDHGVVATGNQFDVASNGVNQIYLISNQFVTFDGSGTVLSSDNGVGDGRQGDLDFPPALAIGPDGAVHVITRHGGDFASGHDLRYRRRNSGGSWDVDQIVGQKVARNYVVGVAALGNHRVFFAHSQVTGDARSTIWFSELTNGTEQSLGSFANDTWLRPDADFRMRAVGEQVALASGAPNPDGRVHFFRASPDNDLVTALAASHQVHAAGSGRKGMPALAIDSNGGVALTYGSRHEVYFNQYEGSAPTHANDIRLFDGLGDWHLSLGLSAVGVTSDGQVRLAVALRSDGSKTASNSDLLFAYSMTPGGAWSAPVEMGMKTRGGEGRLRPRLLSLGDTFFVFYRSTAASGISAASISMGSGGAGGGGPGARSAGGAGGGGGGGGSGGAGGAAGSGGSGGDGGAAGTSGEAGHAQGGVGGIGGSGGVGGASGDSETGGTGGISGRGGASVQPGDESDDGCSCRILGGKGGPWHLMALAMMSFLGGMALRRRLF